MGNLDHFVRTASRILPTRHTLLGAKDEVLQLLARLFPLHAAAWNVAHRAISEMVNASTTEQQAQLIKSWRDSTISQLSQVGFIVSRPAGIMECLHRRANTKLTPNTIGRRNDSRGGRFL
jgi:hypothetical protein